MISYQFPVTGNRKLVTGNYLCAFILNQPNHD